MPKRLVITRVCFHITAALMAIGAVSVLVMLLGPLGSLLSAWPSSGSETDELAGVAIGFMRTMIIATALGLAGCAVGLELVVRGLGRRRYWAWIVGLVVCGFLIFGGLSSYGVTLILGGLSLWGLVDPTTVSAFRPAVQTE